MIEGSGSVLVTNGSWCGSGRSKNIRILRIRQRLRNNASEATTKIMQACEFRLGIWGLAAATCDVEGGCQSLHAVELARLPVVDRIGRHQVGQQARVWTLHPNQRILKQWFGSGFNSVSGSVLGIWFQAGQNFRPPKKRRKKFEISCLKSLNVFCRGLGRDIWSKNYTIVLFLTFCHKPPDPKYCSLACSIL